MFKHLCRPEEESGVSVRVSVHVGKWFVFIDAGPCFGRYPADEKNFLHIDGTRLCELPINDLDCGHVMFDTEVEAFTKSYEFYEQHQEEYPWGADYCDALDRAAVAHGDSSTDGESQVMRFE